MEWKGRTPWSSIIIYPFALASSTTNFMSHFPHSMCDYKAVTPRVC